MRDVPNLASWLESAILMNELKVTALISGRRFPPGETDDPNASYNPLMFVASSVLIRPMFLKTEVREEIEAVEEGESPFPFPASERGGIVSARYERWEGERRASSISSEEEENVVGNVMNLTRLEDRIRISLR